MTKQSEIKAAAVQYWVAKARTVNLRCIYKRWPSELEACRAKRRAYMAAARKAKSTKA